MSTSEQLNAQPKKKGGAAKWWFIGCGGCLVVLIIIAAVIMLAGGAAFNRLMQISSGTVKEIFGESYEVPKGTTAIGIPAGDAEIKKLAVLMDIANGRTLFAVDATLSPEQMQVVRGVDMKEVQHFVQLYGTKLQSSSSPSSNRLDMSDAKFDAAKKVKLNNGKSVPLVLGRVKVSSSSRGEAYSPVAVTMVTKEGQNAVILFAMDVKNTAPDLETELTPL